ncbi:unnamed protein product [Brachionus calyciflorus]|uniref:UBA domain-containing protein n=1 Tax=Brachionus calyciflorus TaxID=104777 RepID=A0A814DZ82_9BILA|nr:unnamed protein product [Brachionus calyciflorus]
MTEVIKSNLAIEDWPTQIAVFKAMYNTDDLHVRYLDDENEEVGIDTQQDLDYAYQIAVNTNNSLKLIIRNSRNELLGKHILNIDLETMRQLKIKRKSSSQQIENQGFSDSQIKWLENYLENFKAKIYSDFESKIDEMIRKKTNVFSNLDEEKDLKKKVNILFSLISEARMSNRALKAAYYEEELQSSQAFMAEFVKDCNLPDGSQCEPNVRLQKTWLIKNTGKIDWFSQGYQIKLININGNIRTECDFVNVEDTKVNETVSVSVDLIAPNKPGSYFSEWVLCCNGFQFGPRIWCSIRVNGESVISSESDDEFVVIPACFDLSKKWTLENTDEKEETMSQKSDSTYKSTEENTIEKSPSQFEINQEELIEKKTETKSAQISNAFDVMKNAFSNLGRPSFVGSVDFIPSVDSNSKEAEMDELMKKLINMGFANRDKNKRLLNEFNFNLEKCVQYLIDDLDNELG